MKLSIGIVGLPNVGKSTLFNALLKRQVALAANYPFATIEPNTGVVGVPDDRLAQLADIIQKNTGTYPPEVPATVTFVDIAGLVQGASKGEGLGNQFLSHIRETNVICHVLRAFQDSDIVREGSTTPQADLDIIRTELQLKDIETLEKQKSPKGSVSKEEKKRLETIQLFLTQLQNGGMINTLPQVAKERGSFASQLACELGLLTAQPELFVINVGEDDLAQGVESLEASFAQELGVEKYQAIIMCNKIESELSSLSDEDQKLYLEDLGLEKSGLERLIQSAYATLGLQSFLTAGEKEVRAWTIPINTTAQKAAGTIHTDFEKHFIKAHVIAFSQFVEAGGWKQAREKGLVRMEGRDYLMQDGDVVEFMVGK